MPKSQSITCRGDIRKLVVHLIECVTGEVVEPERIRDPYNLQVWRMKKIGWYAVNRGNGTFSWTHNIGTKFMKKHRPWIEKYPTGVSLMKALGFKILEMSECEW